MQCHGSDKSPLGNLEFWFKFLAASFMNDHCTEFSSKAQERDVAVV